MPQIRPFRFTNLKRYTAEQIAVEQTFAAYLGGKPFNKDFLLELGSTLESYLKVACHVSTVELRPLARAELPAVIPSTTCLLVVGAAPTPHKLLVDVDMSLASYAIERLLGGSGDDPRIQRPLTEIEQGVLSFIVLKVLAQLHEGWSTGRELALTLDRFAATLTDVQDLIDTEAGYHMVGVTVGLGRKVGYVRTLIPSGLITQTFNAALQQSGGSGSEYETMRRIFQSVGERKVTGRVEIAQLDLGPDVLHGLEVGDIVLLENHQVALTQDGIEGMAFVKVGLAKNGGLRCKFKYSNDHSRLEVAEIVVQEQPLEMDMARDGHSTAEGGDEGGDNLPETEGLLRDVPAPVVVELGRVKLNTAQLIRMRPGQILRLPRGPNDPVDLVVNGKLFARGELIEVDGELGVRLLQVVGAR